MRFIKAVFSKIGHEVEDPYRLFLGDPVRLRSFYKRLFQFFHLLGSLLSHRLPEDIRLSHGEICEFVRNAHHLLLIKDNPVRFIEDFPELGQVVLHGYLSLFSS